MSKWENDPNIDASSPHGAVKISEQVQDDLRVDPDDLNMEFLKQPGLTHHYGTMEVLAEDRFEEAKIEHDVLVAKITEEKRRTYELSGQRIAKATLDGIVSMDPRVRDSSKNLKEARKAKKLAKVAMKAIDHRMSVLISLGANQRAQMQSEPSIRDERPVRVPGWDRTPRFGKTGKTG